MKLTKLQRHTAYILILEYINQEDKNGKRCCLCCSIDSICGVFLSATTNDAKSVFPEYWKKRDVAHYKNDGAYYFKTNSERIAALKQCISETA